MRGHEETIKVVRIGHSVDWMRANYIPRRGVNIHVVAVPDLDHAAPETICKFIANELNPYFPRYNDDIESEINRLKCIEDRVRSQSDYNKVCDPKRKARPSTIIDSIIEGLENTELEPQIKRARNVVTLANGRHMGRIWGPLEHPERSNDRY